MPTISEANNMQIRPPMDVMITLQVGDDVPLTYSGYSSAKVADGRLNEPNRKMMALTDLQGDGYPLDSSCRLYDPDNHPTSADKWGVRSNIGQPVSATVTATESIKYISIWASDCESVTYNGASYPFTSGSVNLYIEDESATLLFNPKYEDRRVEVSLVASGSYYIFDNDSIVSCIVSLRSDLSLINPTLPESEIEVRVFWDEDISERLASIPDGTLITYSAGYSEDMSKTRNFYLSERITWENNVMTIRAVDAVHKLDIQMPTAVLLTDNQDNSVSRANENSIADFVHSSLTYAGVQATGVAWHHYGTTKSSLLFGQTSIREAIATMTAWGRFGEYFNDDYWLNYVDAGIPTLKNSYSQKNWTIDEEDCGDVKRDVDRNIKEIRMPVSELSCGDSTNYISTAVGSGTWIYGSGAFLDFDDNVLAWCVQTEQNTALSSVRSDSTTSNVAIIERNALNSNYAVGLMEEGLPMGSMNTFYTQVMPWNSSQLSAWNQDVGSSVRENQNLHINGTKVQQNKSVQSFASGRDDGEVVTLDEAPIDGKLIVSELSSGTDPITLYPDMATQSILNMSNVTGSFKWKGNPHMQPRDSAIFRRLNGERELITIETITITHEGGGTSAEITYRKGQC